MIRDEGTPTLKRKGFLAAFRNACFGSVPTDRRRARRAARGRSGGAEAGVAMGSDGFSWTNVYVERDGKVSGVEKRAPLVLSPRDAIHRVARLSRRLFFFAERRDSRDSRVEYVGRRAITVLPSRETRHTHAS